MNYRQSTIPKAPQALIRRPGRNVSRREAFDKAQVGFLPEHKMHWVEKISVFSGHPEAWERIFGKSA